MTEDNWAQYVHGHPPRCIAGLHPKPTPRPQPTWLLSPHVSVFRTWTDDSYAPFFTVGCPCGHRAVALLGYYLPAARGDRDRLLTGPLSLECGHCRAISDLFDTRKHGYDGEQGVNTHRVGEGEPDRFVCPRCGFQRLFLCVGCSYSDPEELEPAWPGRAQDFFGGFHVVGQCLRCGSIVEIASFECA
jgi:hypothetical protein